ncbi:MAG: hypothetical protein H6Q92_1253 [Nitrospirae bacterium]|nr:hypothetical protein [Nitrospirota bacterium]
MGKIFTNPNQLEEWIEAAEVIQAQFGIEKALGYVIGEKFYNLVSMLHAFHTRIRAIDEERKKPNYNPIRERTYGNSKLIENLDETYEDEKARVIEAEGLLFKFVSLINQVFYPHEILKYFQSHPRLGAMGHITSEEQYEFLVSTGAIPHSLDTEIEDALIFGDMMKHFGVS